MQLVKTVSLITTTIVFTAKLTKNSAVNTHFSDTKLLNIHNNMQTILQHTTKWQFKRRTRTVKQFAKQQRDTIANMHWGKINNIQNVIDVKLALGI